MASIGVPWNTNASSILMRLVSIFRLFLTLTRSLHGCLEAFKSSIFFKFYMNGKFCMPSLNGSDHIRFGATIVEIFRSEWRKELNQVKTEKSDLLVKLDETTRFVETLVMENTSLDEKVKNLELELNPAGIQIKKMSSEVLSAQKPSSDKAGLGYVDSSGRSSSTASGSKTIFVPQYEKSDKGFLSRN
ncbi:hypothetical protein SO802_006017 [Lithocarpus litseifolius]|uniref:Uncharacterized protein n=1 Tax=Lithocarpus litseifolius TaxID=425828 RepID=A0AAW2DLA0_9ROSI